MYKSRADTIQTAFEKPPRDAKPAYTTGSWPGLRTMPTAKDRVRTDNGPGIALSILLPA